MKESTIKTLIGVFSLLGVMIVWLLVSTSSSHSNRPSPYDYDGDKKISKYEFKAAMASLYAHLDLNHDSKVQFEEIRKRRDESSESFGQAFTLNIRINQFDLNNDRIIERGEMLSAEIIQELFIEYDSNEDGFIEPDEGDGTKMIEFLFP